MNGERNLLHLIADSFFFFWVHYKFWSSGPSSLLFHMLQITAFHLCMEEALGRNCIVNCINCSVFHRIICILEILLPSFCLPYPTPHYQLFFFICSIRGLQLQKVTTSSILSTETSLVFYQRSDFYDFFHFIFPFLLWSLHIPLPQLTFSCLSSFMTAHLFYFLFTLEIKSKQTPLYLHILSSVLDGPKYCLYTTFSCLFLAEAAKHPVFLPMLTCTNLAEICSKYSTQSFLTLNI